MTPTTLTAAEAAWASVFGDGRLPLDRLRRNLDAMMTAAPLPPGTPVAEESVAGVPCLRVGTGSRTLVWFHGGGYVMGSPHGYRGAAAALSAALDAEVLLPDYRLAPEHPFPAAFDDAAAVLGALDPDTLLAGGDSAGGGLVLTALTAARDRGAALPKAVLTVSPLADFTAAGDSYTTNAATDPVITARALRGIAASYLRGHDPRDPRVSPVFARFHDLPPILFLAGEREALRDDAVRMHAAARAAGNGGALSIHPDTCHAWTLFTELPRARKALAEMADFVNGALP
ncbi:alpha/beta hydrolase fold domain-containing protein [Nocardia sp. NPDC057353]|uniref:alpha/beta hydrolase fold domain-containing protein n=1 Tax=Nocardia sp. NPDC057353 TaxID=3346104 RepID=UPI00363D81FF